jgi:hypothetical protein
MKILGTLMAVSLAGAEVRVSFLLEMVSRLLGAQKLAKMSRGAKHARSVSAHRHEVIVNLPDFRRDMRTVET